jgi:aspartate carbamoyltransferase catalytic subunit
MCMVKYCSVCKKPKFWYEFTRRKGTPLLSGFCKSCQAEKNKFYRRKDIEKSRCLSRIQHHKHKDKHQAKKKKYARWYQKENKEIIKFSKEIKKPIPVARVFMEGTLADALAMASRI